MSDERAREAHYLDYFVAYIPAGAVFSARIDQLRELVANRALGPISEICLVALVAYFEAFCKDQFAAVINLCPKILDNFAKRRTIAVELSDLMPFIREVERRLGFLLSERYDFGPPKTINSLYRDLLGITPLSKDEVQKDNQLLDQRNLLVHHGGVFTIKHAKKHFPGATWPQFAHVECVEVTPESFQDWTAFLERIAKKTVVTSHRAAEKFIMENKIELDPERAEALRFLGYFD